MKRFTVDEGLEDVLCWEINDKENENMTCGECAKLLNELHEENIHSKRLLRVADEIIRHNAPLGIVEEWIKEMEEKE